MHYMTRCHLLINWENKTITLTGDLNAYIYYIYSMQACKNTNDMTTTTNQQNSEITQHLT